MKLSKEKNQLLLILLAVGFFVGIFYQNLASGGETVSWFQQYFLNQFAQTELVAEEYIWYVAGARLLPFVCLCIAGAFRWRKGIVCLGLIWTGFLAGVLTVSAVLALGAKGILLCIVGMLPQMLFYVPAYGMVLVYLYRYPKKQWNTAKTIFVCLSLLIGLILEVYLNPIILKWVLRFFVS